MGSTFRYEAWRLKHNITENMTKCKETQQNFSCVLWNIAVSISLQCFVKFAVVTFRATVVFVSIGYHFVFVNGMVNGICFYYYYYLFKSLLFSSLLTAQSALQNLPHSPNNTLMAKAAMHGANYSSGAIWGSVSCSRTLRYAAGGGGAGFVPVTFWATAAHVLMDMASIFVLIFLREKFKESNSLNVIHKDRKKVSCSYTVIYL